jgi:small subunit ribosomal protein S1
MTNPTDPVPDQSSSSLDADLQRELDAALGGKSLEELMEEASAPPPAPIPGAGAAAADEAQSSSQPQRFVPEMVRGRIAAIRADDVFVDVTGAGGKNQGVVPLEQFDRPPRVGSIMDFVIERLDDAEGLMILSREGAVSRATWDQLRRGAIVEARVVAHNKGGLELEMIGGIRAFMPASQIDLHHVDEIESYVGQKLQATVQEIDHRSKKVVLSRRQFLEVERAAKQQKMWDDLAVGQVREGRISSLAEYGAFVDLGGLDGLVHISDMSYSRLDRPDQLVKAGQVIQVKVLKIDREKNRISLGIKQIAPDPWEGIEGRLKHGDQVTGRVLRTADFGAFVEVFPGVEGLLPLSEISWKRIAHVTESVHEGDSLRLVVLQLDAGKKRLSLSLKQAGGDPWVGAEHTYAKNSMVEGTVLSIADFGAFVEIAPGIEGLVHISELSDRRVGAVGDVVKVGEKHQLRVLEVDEDTRRIRLSLKAAKEPVVVEKPAPAPAATPAATAAVAAAAAKAAKPRKTGKLKSGLGTNAALGMGLGDLKF